MRPITPTPYTTPGLFPRQTRPSSPPSTPTTPNSVFRPSPSPSESPSATRRRPPQNFSRPLAPPPRGSQNRYAPLAWQDLGNDEGGGYIQPLGPGTNQFSYVPASRGRPDDPSLSPESSEDDDDDGASSISPRSMITDDEFVEREAFQSPGFKNNMSGKGSQGEDTDEDEDMDAESDRGKINDRGRRRRSTLKATTNFTLEELPSRSQERDLDDLPESSTDSLPIIQPDQYSDAETAPSRSHSIGLQSSPPKSSKPRTQPITRSIKNFQVSDNTDTDTPPTLDPKIMESMSSLNCSGEASEDEREAWLRRQKMEKRQRRWELGSQKRSITQSIGSGTDEEDLHGDGISVVGGDEGGLGVGGSARRLRRRTLTGEGGGRPNFSKRGSLLFEDPPRRILEVEEPESDFGGGGGGGGGEEREEEAVDDELPYFLRGEGDVDMDY